ncbi:DUF6783 domain-containing protein [Robinsoniella peoriensis]
MQMAGMNFQTRSSHR